MPEDGPPSAKCEEVLEWAVEQWQGEFIIFDWQGRDCSTTAFRCLLMIKKKCVQRAESDGSHACCMAYMYRSIYILKYAMDVFDERRPRQRTCVEVMLRHLHRRGIPLGNWAPTTREKLLGARVP